MQNMGTAMKAIVMVLGGLALLGLLVLTAPIWGALLTVLLGMIEIFLPIVLIIAAIVIVYLYLKNKNES